MTVRRLLRRSAAAAPVLALAACAEASIGPPLTVTDSLGVTVVENGRTFADVPLRALPVDREREIVDDALYQVTAIRPLPEGIVAVGVSGSASVLLYDANGQRVRELGRRGDGPGEFRSVQSLLLLPGDSLGVYDSQLRRLTVFPPEEGAPRVLSLAELAPDRGWSRVHRLADGLAFVGEAGLGGTGDAGVYRNTAPSYRIGLDGRVVATYGEFPGLEAFAGGGMMGRAPFGALLATAPLGRDLVVGTGEHAELRIYDPAGALSRIVRWADRDRTVSPERAERFVDFLVSQGPPDQADAMRDRLAGLPLAPRAPAHAELLTSPEGVLWVGEYAGPESEMPAGRRLAPRRWVILEPDGAMRERVETEAGFMPMALDGGLVWGVHFDELDVESVRAYRVGGP